MGMADARKGQVFRIRFTEDADVLAPGDRVMFMLTASNAGTTDLLDVSPEVLLPEFTNSFIEAGGLDCPRTTCDDTDRMHLSVAPGSGPAEAGDPFTYTLRVSNIAMARVVNPVLEMPLPEEVSFVSASDGGPAQEGRVSWTLGPMGAGAGQQLTLTVLPEALLPEDALLEARADLNPNETAEPVVRADAVRPVRGGMHYVSNTA